MNRGEKQQQALIEKVSEFKTFEAGWVSAWIEKEEREIATEMQRDRKHKGISDYWKQIKGVNK